MANPFQARRTRSQGADLPIARLRRLGASQAVIDEVSRRWATEMSLPEREAARAELAAMSDAELTDALAEMEGGQSTLELGEYPASGTVDEVLAWVGTDPERAKQALAAEQERPKPRATALNALTKLAE